MILSDSSQYNDAIRQILAGSTAATNNFLQAAAARRASLAAADQGGYSYTPGAAGNGDTPYGPQGVANDYWGNPDDPNFMSRYLTNVGFGGHNYLINKHVANNFLGFLNALTGSGYKINSLGTYANRNKRGGSTKSEHAWGLAFDINPGDNPWLSHRTNLPRNIVDLARRFGLEWGGNWRHHPDPMHFQFRYT